MTNTTVENSSKFLDFKAPMALFIFFVLLVGMLLFLGNYLSEKRKDEVLETYTSETNNYIAQNRSSLINLFTNIFPSGVCPYSFDNQQGRYLQECPKQELIAKSLPQSLKDWSSTGFLKEVNGTLYFMNLSGGTQEFYTYEEKDKIVKLMRGEVASIPWNEYTYNLPGKDVVVPVEDDSGKVIGAIIRGVVEK